MDADHYRKRYDFNSGRPKNYFILLNDMLPITKFTRLREKIQRIKKMHPVPGESLIRIASRAGKWNATHLLTEHGGQNTVDDLKIAEKSLFKEILDRNYLHSVKHYVQENYILILNDVRDAIKLSNTKAGIRKYLQSFINELIRFNASLMKKKISIRLPFCEKISALVVQCFLNFMGQDEEMFVGNNPNFGYLFRNKLKDLCRRQCELEKASEGLSEMTGQRSSIVEDLLFPKLSTHDLSKL